MAAYPACSAWNAVCSPCAACDMLPYPEPSSYIALSSAQTDSLSAIVASGRPSEDAAAASETTPVPVKKTCAASFFEASEEEAKGGPEGRARPK